MHIDKDCTMLIIAVEGLSLVGKTTLCNQLMEHYIMKNVSCSYRKKGRLTGNYDIDPLSAEALRCIEEWDFQNRDTIHRFIRYGFHGMIEDYEQFLSNEQLYSSFDLMILDRHFTDQYVVADHFGYEYEPVHNILENYLEIALLCDHRELKRRSMIRNDNHGKLTDYTLGSQEIHNSFQKSYSVHVLSHGGHILENTGFSALQDAIALIDRRLDYSVQEERNGKP